MRSPIHILDERHAGVAAKAARKGARASLGDGGEITFAEGLGQMAVDISKHLIDAGRHKAGRIGQITSAGE